MLPTSASVPQLTKRPARTRQSALSLAGGVLFTVATVVTGAVATPIIFRALGQERFGALRAMTDAFGYLFFLEMGLSGSVMTCLVRAIGRNDDQAVRRTMASGWRAYWLITAAMLLGGIALTLLLPAFFHLRTVNPREFQLASTVMLLGVLITPATLFRSLAEARQRGYIVHIAVTAIALVSTFFGVIAATAGWGLPGQAASSVAAAFVVYPLLIKDGAACVPGWLGTLPDSETTRSLWRLNWPMFTIALSTRVATLSDSLLVAVLVSPALVAPFYLTQRLVGAVQPQLLNIGNATWAGLSELHLQGHKGTMRERLLELSTVVTAVSLVLLVPVCAYNRAFVSRWVGPSMYASDLLTLTACVNVWLSALVGLWGWSVSGTGNVRLILPVTLASLAVNIAVSVVTTLGWGIIGPLVGTLVALLAVSIWAIPRLLSRLFELPAAALVKSALRPLTYGLPYGICVWMTARKWPPINWWQLLAESTLSALAGAALFLVVMPAAARNAWRVRLATLLAGD